MSKAIRCSGTKPNDSLMLTIWRRNAAAVNQVTQEAKGQMRTRPKHTTQDEWREVGKRRVAPSGDTLTKIDAPETLIVLCRQHF